MPFFNFFNCDNYDCNEVTGVALYMGYRIKRRAGDWLDIYPLTSQELVGRAYFNGVSVKATINGVTYTADYLNEILDAIN